MGKILASNTTVEGLTSKPYKMLYTTTKNPTNFSVILKTTQTAIPFNTFNPHLDNVRALHINLLSNATFFVVICIFFLHTCTCSRGTDQ